MAAGPFIEFDYALLKTRDGTILTHSHTFHMVLLGSAQALSRSFVGGSGDCRYADLTAELTTANGYTTGGVALTTIAWSRVGTPKVKWTSDPATWTLTGAGITYKYAAVVDWTDANKSLWGFMDLDTGGGSISPVAGPHSISPNATDGFFYDIQP